jgi:hypothetical protein
MYESKKGIRAARNIACHGYCHRRTLESDLNYRSAGPFWCQDPENLVCHFI